MTLSDPAPGSCATATGPLAYLADLLDYAARHVRDASASLTLPEMAARFQQPLADLPGSCESMEREVSRVRLVVEVLRSYLASRALPAAGSAVQAALAAAEQAYRTAAYEALLGRLATSSEQVRRAATASAEERARLAGRLGVAVDKLNALAIEPRQLSEPALERMFGLADTRRDVLSDGAKSDDAQNQVTRWRLDGVAWATNTDADGAVHVRLRKVGTNVQVSLFRDGARSQQVAAGARTTATGPVALRPVGNSGLSGQLTINYTADSDAVSIAAVPMVLAWRLQNARAQQPSPESPDQAQARLDQELALAAQWTTGVSESEAATLPALRDALVVASDAVGADASAKARSLTDRLLIDVEVAPSLCATRASQAIETVQGLLVSLRTGQISDSHPDLTLVAERFDEEWTWLGSYATWRAAVAVYLYPENLLLPTLRRRQTPAFRELASDLRNGRRCTPAQARTLARAYEDYFRDVCSLTVHSSCLAVSRPGAGAADQTLFHLFAVGGKTKSLYWSAGDVAPAADPAQTFWERLPKPAGFERLVASIPYETSEPRRFIYLFAQTNDRGTPGLAYLRHDLDNPSWEAEWTVLELPEVSGRHDITPVQSQAAGEPPAFFIRVQAGLYVRGLDEEGDTWESPGADDESTDVWAAFRVPGLVTATPVAVVRTAGQPAGTYWLCQHVKGRGVIVRKQGGLPSAPNDAFAAVEIGGADARFAGAFAREGADEIVVFHGTGRAGRGTRAGSVITPPGPAELKYRRVRVGNAGTDRTATALTGVRSLVPRFDAGKENQRQTAWQKSGERMRGVMSFNATTEAITVSGAVRSAPKVDALIPIAEDGPRVNQTKRRADVLAAVEGNKTVEANLAYVAEACFFVPTQIALQLQARGQFTAALDWFRSIYDYRLPEASRKIYHGLRLEESLPAPPAALTRAADWLLDPLNPHAIAATRRGAFSRGTLLSLLGCFLDFADAEFTRDTVESLPRARMLYITALELLGAPELQGGGPQTLATPVPGPTGNFEIVVNPLFAAQRFRAENNLFKLRTGRNIAGLERDVEPYAAPTGSALPAIGTGGQIVVPGSVSIRPTPYRYSVLVERARQLVQLASQMEAAMLAALEKRDAELYSLLKARQDVDLTRAGVRLQDLRVREAEDGVKLAELQRDRAQSQADYYQERLDERLLASELLSMLAMGAAIGLEATAAGILLAASGITLGVTAVPGFQAAATAASSTASLLATIASYERRRQEWEFQNGLAIQDVRIGSQQVKLADDHVRIAGQERTIADMQAGHAEAALEFLAGKFTNAELFDWMSGVLERVYAYFLQQASAVARLAENQLAFERQETPPAIIQADYWEVPADSAEESTDRRGLTGSARLLQDLTRLDQHAFETDRRKLQLTRTFSLARLAPVEFQQFRETGSILFATPMELFDRDFPGHYLRLIKRVRTSVIALIPPGEGVRATLSTPGTSRVTIGGGPFQTIVISQGPQSVALTSAQNASGVFELDLQPELLLPFEGSGVDTVWHLAMPKAANPFDYGTLADVLLTIEYTALDSADYRQQVIATLDPALSASRPFSFRHQFADAWYDLHNPTQTAQPMTVRFTTRREDFPPNVEAVRLQHLALYFSRAAGQTFEVQVDRLRLSAQGNAAPVNAAAATSVNGIISTRLANGGPWTAFLGQEPFGEWELTLPDTVEMRGRFENEAVEDILFVITYTARTPPWPTMP